MNLYLFFGDFTLKLEDTYNHIPRAIAFFTDQVVYSWGHPVNVTVRNLVRLEEV